LVAEGKQLLGDRVRFLVRFPRQRMAELYRSADAFALCSLKEMMPIALLEAIASGLPCIVNRHPVLAWMSGPGGEAIDMAATGALAGAVDRLLSERSRRHAMAEGGRAHCEANFSVERVVNDICDYYRYVLGSTAMRRAA
jgi:D-inositol-3-phosphate glycosyltransferase